uniref:Secreted protein n=1 Tax=Nelumbo nucifera TaxID=4432 RepID=A0A822YXS7_NELNU|nr:TPA_asm: hypothetical protein HUJ06_007951 [Nelumbo nucifera]
MVVASIGSLLRMLLALFLKIACLQLGAKGQIMLESNSLCCSAGAYERNGTGGYLRTKLLLGLDSGKEP